MQHDPCPTLPFVQIPADLIREVTERTATVLVTYGLASFMVDWRTRRGPVSWAALVDETGYDRGTIARHFAWLIRRGFVEPRAGPIAAIRRSTGSRSRERVAPRRDPFSVHNPRKVFHCSAVEIVAKGRTSPIAPSSLQLRDTASVAVIPKGGPT